MATKYFTYITTRTYQGYSETNEFMLSKKQMQNKMAKLNTSNVQLVRGVQYDENGKVLYSESLTLCECLK